MIPCILAKLVYKEVRHMPVHETPGGGYQWGSKGKIYYGKGAKQKAARQGAAIRISKQKQGRKKGK